MTPGCGQRNSKTAQRLNDVKSNFWRL